MIEWCISGEPALQGRFGVAGYLAEEASRPKPGDGAASDDDDHGRHKPNETPSPYLKFVIPLRIVGPLRRPMGRAVLKSR
jgi:hypothetical protein